MATFFGSDAKKKPETSSVDLKSMRKKTESNMTTDFMVKEDIRCHIHNLGFPAIHCNLIFYGYKHDDPAGL